MRFRRHDSDLIIAFACIIGIFGLWYNYNEYKKESNAIIERSRAIKVVEVMK